MTRSPGRTVPLGRRDTTLQCRAVAGVLWLALAILFCGPARPQPPGPPPQTSLQGGDRVVRDEQFAALLRPGTDVRQIGDPLDLEGFIEQLRELREQYFHLVEVEVSIRKDLPHYTGLWRQGGGRSHFEPGLEWDDLQAKMLELEAGGLRLMDFEPFVDQGIPRYAGLWSAGEGRQELRVGLGEAEFQAAQQELLWQGMRLVDFEYDASRGTYAGLWHPAAASGGSVEVLVLNRDWSTFEFMLQDLARGGLRIDDLEIYEYREQARYSGVWHTATDAYWVWLGFDRRCLDHKVEWLGLSRADKALKPLRRCGERPHEHGGEETRLSGQDRGAGEDHPAPDSDSPPLTPALGIVDLEFTGSLPHPVHRHGKPTHLGVLHDSGGAGPGG